jgi:hypothetical protein
MGHSSFFDRLLGGCDAKRRFELRTPSFGRPASSDPKEIEGEDDASTILGGIDGDESVAGILTGRQLVQALELDNRHAFSVFHGALPFGIFTSCL